MMKITGWYLYYKHTRNTIHSIERGITKNIRSQLRV